MHPLLLLPAYLAITVAPLVLGWLQYKPPRPFLDEVSSGLAMAAFAILLVEFMLSGRFRAISAQMGMDVTMRFHQLVARAALAFVIAHPFLYSLPFFNTPLPWDETGQLTLGLDAGSLITGVISWAILPSFVLLSIFRDQFSYCYETWRAMHAIGAVIIVVLVTHHALAAGRYSADLPLAIFWIVLLTAALASLGWTYIIAPLGEAGHPYEVASVRKIALKTWELTVTPLKREALRFEAGQFAWLNLGHTPFSLHENPFSISSAPAERPEIRFVIKEIGDLTRRIGDVKPGTRAFLDGAYGNLTLKGRKSAGIALIAGGVGIAPLISIARQLRVENDPRPMILLYGNRIAEQIVYESELTQIASSTNAQVIHVVSEPKRDWTGLTGRIDETTIDRVFNFGGAAEWLYLICGPPPMLDAVEDALLARGVPSDQIVVEQFYYD